MKKLKTFKGFNPDMTCRDFQYEVGKEYETPKAERCREGFHSCENPLDVFSYYPPGSSIYCSTIASGNVDKEKGGDSKVASTKLKIEAKINLFDMIQAGVEWIKKKVNWEDDKESNTGNQSAATNTGNRSAATNTGNRSAATNTGYQSAATNTGYQSAAEVSGKESVAMAVGYKSKAKGSKGCWLVLAEWEDNHIKDVKCRKVDGGVIKADVWYELVNGRFREVGG